MSNLFTKFLKISGARGALAHVQGRPLHASLNALNGLWRWRVVVAAIVALAWFGAQFALLTLPQAEAAYTIANSARFNDDDSANLSKTFSGAPADRKKGTISTWIKRGNLGTRQTIVAGYDGSSSNSSWLEFGAGGAAADNLSFAFGGATSAELRSSALFRDPSKWMHVVVVWDTTDATAANRVKMYIDGMQITAFDAANYPAQNAEYQFALANANNRIGQQQGGACCSIDVYLSDLHFVDGQALTPTSFGEYDANGYWRPKSYTGTYGTNGFKLAFGNSAALGTDTSGNGNNWTANNLDATDQVIDTPTNAFATLNSIYKNSSLTLSQGNLSMTHSAGNFLTALSIIGVTSGKWYWEVTAGAQSSGSNFYLVGVATSTAFTPMTLGAFPGGSSANGGISYYGHDGTTYNGGTNAAYGNTFTTNDVVGVALDLDNKKIYFSKNGTWQNSGDPVGGTGAAATLSGADPVFPSLAVYTGASASINFGQPGTTTTTHYSAAGGYFRYEPPSGFKALSTANLPEPDVVVPKNYFDAIAYAGTGAAKSVYQTGTSTTVTGFSPDLVWIKNRTDASTNHALFDALRGVQAWLSSNLTAGEDVDDTESLTSYDDNGFSLGSGASSANVNTSGKNYISWLWKETAEAGFDIVSYKGTGKSRTVSHSLGKAPDFMLVKEVRGDWAQTSNSLTISGINTPALAALSATRVAYVDFGNASLRAYDLSSSNWSLTGSGLSISGIGSPSLATMLSSRVAFIDSGNDDLRAYDFNGSTWSLTGNELNISGVGSPALAGLLSDRIAFIDGTNDDLRAYDFDGTNWTLTGNELNISGITLPSLAALSASRVALYDYSGTKQLRAYDFDGTNWSQVGNSLTIESSGGSTGMAALGRNRVAFVDSTTNELRVYAFDGTDWREVADGSGIVDGTTPNPAVAALSATSVAIADQGSAMLRSYTQASGSGDWAVYHSSNTSAPATDYLLLNSTAATADDATYWNDTAPTASAFTVGTNADVNKGGAAHFDGTNDYLTRGANLTDVVDGKRLTVSFWVNITGADSTNQTIAATGDLGTGFYIVRTAGTQVIQVVGLDASNNFDMILNSSTQTLASSGWVHYLFSVDLNTGSAWVYRNDVSDFNSGGSTLTNDTIDWTRGNFAVGAEPDAGFKLTGDIKDLWIKFGTSLDLSVEANRRFFIDANGEPVPVIGVGSTLVPDVYFSGTSDNWHINRGRGGAFTENGALTDSSSTPGGVGGGSEYAAYLFASTTGMSAFGSYTGNGSTDGPFVYTGFKPRFVMLKPAVGTTGSWWMLDTTRNTYNPISGVLGADGSSQESAPADVIDSLANGFKLRTTFLNTSGDTMVYAAFAEQPFKYSAAPAATSNSFVQALALMLGMEI